MDGIGRLWRACRRRRRWRRRLKADRAAGRRNDERNERIALITPVELVCRPESWARIVALTTFRVPDSNWTVSPLRHLPVRPLHGVMVGIELDEEALGRLLLDMAVDDEVARYLYSPVDAVFIKRVYRLLHERVESVNPRRTGRGNGPAQPLFLDSPPGVC